MIQAIQALHTRRLPAATAAQPVMRSARFLTVAFFASSIDVASCFMLGSTGRFVSSRTCGATPLRHPRVGGWEVDKGRRGQKRWHRLEAKKGRADKKSGRPSLDDVERLSRGEAAKKRGTGSRAVCHRLNESERKAYDLAKKQGYVVLRGTGYRRERKGSPLLNTFRQFCDAKAMSCTSVLTGLGPDAIDEVEIDFSPLRAPRETTDSLGERADGIASEIGALRVEEGADGDAVTTSSVAGVAAGEAQAAADGTMTMEEEEEEEELPDPNNLPIWRFPPISQVYRCSTRKEAKDVAQALSSVR